MEWETVDVKQQAHGGGFVTLTAGDHGTILFSSDLNAADGRYELLKCANLFALKRSNDGQLSTTPIKGGCRIHSRGAVRIIREAFGLSEDAPVRLRAWKDDDMIVFCKEGEHHE